MPPLPLSLLLLLLLQLSSLQLLSSTYAPPDKYFIDCGSGCNTTVSDGRIFVGDLNPPFAFSPGESKHVGDSNLSNNTPSLYRMARIFRDPSSYELEVDHNGTYMVRLHIFPFSSPINLSDAVFKFWADSSSFNLSASAFLQLFNFSVSDSSLSVIEEFLLSINEGKFSFYFVPSQKPFSSFAIVNTIEVFSVPDHFISDSGALPIKGQPMKTNQSTADGSYFGFAMVMGIIAMVPDLKRRKAMLATGENNSQPQDSQAERNEIIPVAPRKSVQRRLFHLCRWLCILTWQHLIGRRTVKVPKDDTKRRRMSK